MLWPNRMAPNILSALRLVIAATAQLWGISRLVLPSPSSSPFLLCVHLSTNCILVAINVPALALFYPSSLRVLTFDCATDGHEEAHKIFVYWQCLAARMID